MLNVAVYILPFETIIQYFIYIKVVSITHCSFVALVDEKDSPEKQASILTQEFDNEPDLFHLYDKDDFFHGITPFPRSCLNRTATSIKCLLLSRNYNSHLTWWWACAEALRDVNDHRTCLASEAWVEENGGVILFLCEQPGRGERLLGFVRSPPKFNR